LAVQAQAPDNSQNPRLQGGFTAELRQRPVNFDKGILDNLFCIAGVAQDLIGYMITQTVILSQNLTEGRLVTCQDALDELRITRTLSGLDPQSRCGRCSWIPRHVMY
jgi:hypothetical protein